MAETQRWLGTTMASSRLVRWLILIVPAVSWLQAGAEATESKIAVEVTVTTSKEQHALQFTVRNASSREVSLSKGSLPWACPTSVLVLANGYRPGHWAMELPEKSVGAGSGCQSGQAAIAPGKSLSGSVALDDRIEGMAKALGNGNVVIFWYWRPNVDGDWGAGIGGYSVIRGQGEVGVAEVADGGPSVQVEAYAMETREPTLGFMVSNQTAENVSIPFKNLPWLQGARIAVRAGILEPSRSLETAVADADRRNPRAWATLPPRGFVWGDIPLSNRVRDLEGARDDHDVVVFWFCQLQGVGDDSLAEQGGFVVFPKQKAN